MRDILEDLEAGHLLSDPDPVKRAQNQMRIALPKRFYNEVAVVPTEYGDQDVFEIHLDGKPVRTPAKTLMRLPTHAAAELVAAEFVQQEEVINPVMMPVMRLTNTAIDGVLRESDAVSEDVLKFGGSDLLCYRAEGPQGLVDRQIEAWDPVVDWAARAFGARFTLTEGVVHVTQPVAALAALRTYLMLRQRGEFWLTALHLMTSLTGSALLALAVEAEEVTAEEAWRAAHVDEDWQIEHWGQDSEAVARRNARWRDMNAAASMIAALRD